MANNEPRLYPLMRGGVTGTLEITENGTYDVKQYASVEVDVEGGGSSEPVGDETTIDVISWADFYDGIENRTIEAGQAYYVAYEVND